MATYPVFILMGDRNKHFIGEITVDSDGNFWADITTCLYVEKDGKDLEVDQGDVLFPVKVRE